MKLRLSKNSVKQKNLEKNYLVKHNEKWVSYTY